MGACGAAINGNPTNMISWRSSRINTVLRCPRRFQWSRNIVLQPRAPLAFAFDIDGVLLQGPSVIPAAKRALSILEGDNALKLKIPYILITNGGGFSEEDRCQKLTSQLGVKIGMTQLVQSHTLLKLMAHENPEEPVLVLGGTTDRIRKVAESYGFRNVYISADILAWKPEIWPFHTLRPEEASVVKKIDFSRTPISSILVFHDPRNWALDIQVIVDILRSNSRCPGAPYRTGAADEPPPVRLVFCNEDLLWRGAHSQPRLGQGAFVRAFQAVYKSLTGQFYPHTQYGKPHAATYKFAEKMLLERAAVLDGRPLQLRDLPQIYMIGDNPASDIAGANAAKWSSVLVRTGVYNPADGPPAHIPTHEANDVEVAVKWALEREGIMA